MEKVSNSKRARDPYELKKEYNIYLSIGTEGCDFKNYGDWNTHIEEKCRCYKSELLNLERYMEKELRKYTEKKERICAMHIPAMMLLIPMIFSIVALIYTLSQTYTSIKNDTDLARKTQLEKNIEDIIPKIEVEKDEKVKELMEQWLRDWKEEQSDIDIKILRERIDAFGSSLVTVLAWITTGFVSYLIIYILLYCCHKRCFSKNCFYKDYQQIVKNIK